jgi:hypothetical protein
VDFDEWPKNKKVKMVDVFAELVHDSIDEGKI